MDYSWFRLALIAGIAMVCIGVLVLIWVLYMRLVQWKRLLSRKYVYMELTPPVTTGRTPEATQKLFAVIHGFHGIRTVKEKLLRQQVVMSFEIGSSRAHGIRYIVQVDKQLASSLHKAINSYLPEVKVKTLEDNDKQPQYTKVISFKQTGHYAFPLAAASHQDTHDPATYLTGALTKLDSYEQLRFQIVLTPIKLRQANILAHKILGNEDLLTELSGRKVPIWSDLVQFMNKVVFGITDTASELYHGSTKQSYQASQKDAHQKLQVAKRLRPARILSALELEIMESIHQKVKQPLFRASIRVAIKSDDSEKVRTRLGAIRSSLESYTVPSYQSLRARLSLPVLNRFWHYMFINRLPSLLGRDCILSASEIANIYHFPSDRSNRADNVATSLSRTLPAPISLKQNKKFDVVLGRNYHHGIETEIGLSLQERERHVYIIGGTGNGKTTMLQYAIAQDMQNGKGLAVIDPHGDLAETLLRRVPEDRINDVVYFNPDDVSHPFGLNLLELPEGLSDDELVREKDLITESVVSIFRKIFSEEDTGGHRIEYVLRNTIQTALTVEGATLFTIFNLLNDSKYRRNVTKTLENEDLKNFWKNELGKAGEMQRVKMAAGITAKIGRFLFSASAKRILEQPKSTIDFDNIINSGKILICNFSKGLLGEDTSELFGITVLAKLQLASLRRARLQQSARRPFFLYVDEFQNFATPSFVQMLSESRKYKLFMLMAEQSTSQQKDQQMVNIILANVGTVICFRTGNPADEQLLLPLFSPYIERGEIANLSAFNFYARLAAVHAQEPLSGQTLLLDDKYSEGIAAKVIKHSRNVHGLKVDRQKIPVQEPDVIKSKIHHPKKRKDQGRLNNSIQESLPTV